MSEIVGIVALANAEGNVPHVAGTACLGMWCSVSAIMPSPLNVVFVGAPRAAAWVLGAMWVGVVGKTPNPRIPVAGGAGVGVGVGAGDGVGVGVGVGAGDGDGVGVGAGAGVGVGVGEGDGVGVGAGAGVGVGAGAGAGVGVGADAMADVSPLPPPPPQAESATLATRANDTLKRERASAFMSDSTARLAHLFMCSHVACLHGTTWANARGG